MEIVAEDNPSLRAVTMVHILKKVEKIRLLYILQVVALVLVPKQPKNMICTTQKYCLSII